MAGFDIALVLSVLSLVIALVVGLPMLVQYAIFYFHTPELDITLYGGAVAVSPTKDKVNWSELDQPEYGDIKRVPEGPYIQFRNFGSRELDYHISKFTIEYPSFWRLNDVGKSAYRKPYDGKIIMKEGFLMDGEETIPNQMAPSIKFPLIPEDPGGEMKMVAELYIRPHEFKIPRIGRLPRVFGDIQIRPVSKTLEIERSKG